MNVAIFGAGSIGTRHADNARALDHQAVVFDIDPSKSRFHPDVFLPSAFDAVMICTPAETHEDVALGLLQAGYRRALFVEKPLALKSASPVFSTWPHPVTMVGYNWRFHPELAHIRGLMGEGTSIYLDCRTDISAWPGTVYADPMLECSHEIDLAMAWLGETCTVRGGSLDGDDRGAWIQMQHERGHSVVDLRWKAEPSRRMVVHLPGWTRLCIRPSVEAASPALRASYRHALHHFLDAVRLHRSTDVPFAQGLRVVRVCERVKEFTQ